MLPQAWPQAASKRRTVAPVSMRLHHCAKHHELPEGCKAGAQLQIRPVRQGEKAGSGQAQLQEDGKAEVEGVNSMLRVGGSDQQPYHPRGPLLSRAAMSSQDV